MQIDVAVFKIRRFFRQQKRLPSYQEMCGLFGFASKKASFDVVQKLIKAGILAKDPQGKLIPKKLFPPLPVLGTIKAGYPTSSEEQLLETLSFDEFLVNKPDKSYMLKVSGDSMIEAGINPGDIVVLEKDRSPQVGDVVVAFIDNEWTLKHFDKKNGKVYLRPANPKYPPIYPQRQLTIEGVVVSVIRKYH